MRKIRLETVSRIEGALSLEIKVDSRNNLTGISWKTDLFRAFETLGVGRPLEEMPFLMARICGICAEAHHLASLQAAEKGLGISPPEGIRKIREAFGLISWLRDHLTVLLLFSGPDLESFPSPNSLSWLEKTGLWDLFLENRKHLRRMLEIVGGRGHLALGGIPGGWGKKVSSEERKELGERNERVLLLARKTWELYWEKTVSQPFLWPVQSPLVALSPEGSEVLVLPPGKIKPLRFPLSRFYETLVESEEGSFFKKISLPPFGAYLVGPLARFYLFPSPDFPLSREAHQSLKSIGKPDLSRAPLFRAYEVLWAAERLKHLLPELPINQPVSSAPLKPVRTEGLGAFEAPRGLLFHRYTLDPDGVIKTVKIITPTTQNLGVISDYIPRFWPYWPLKEQKRLLFEIQRFIRTFDPCVPCMVHLLRNHPRRDSPPEKEDQRKIS